MTLPAARTAAETQCPNPCTAAHAAAQFDTYRVPHRDPASSRTAVNYCTNAKCITAARTDYSFVYGTKRVACLLCLPYDAKPHLIEC